MSNSTAPQNMVTGVGALLSATEWIGLFNPICPVWTTTTTRHSHRFPGRSGRPGSPRWHREQCAGGECPWRGGSSGAEGKKKG